MIEVAPSGQPISPRQEGILDGRSAIFLKDRNDKKAAHCERNAAHEDSTAVLPETEVGPILSIVLSSLDCIQ